MRFRRQNCRFKNKIEENKFFSRKRDLEEVIYVNNKDVKVISRN